MNQRRFKCIAALVFLALGQIYALPASPYASYQAQSNLTSGIEVANSTLKITPKQTVFPGLNDFLPTLPSLTSGLPAFPTISPANLIPDVYAFCFTYFYGARKCCIGVILPPTLIRCEPNEKKRKEKVIAL